MKLPNQDKLLVKATVISAVFDIPAKSDALGLGNHRGKYACSRCQHPGKLLRTERGMIILHSFIHKL